MFIRCLFCVVIGFSHNFKDFIFSLGHCTSFGHYHQPLERNWDSNCASNGIFKSIQDPLVLPGGPGSGDHGG